MPKDRNSGVKQSLRLPVGPGPAVPQQVLQPEQLQGAPPRVRPVPQPEQLQGAAVRVQPVPQLEEVQVAEAVGLARLRCRLE